MRSLLERRLPSAERSLLQEAGKLAADMDMRLFLAGGSVRDIILNRPREDWDIVVEGDGPTFARMWGACCGARVVIHDRFLTAVVRAPGGTFDVATSRRERYPAPGALPEVEPAAIADDLWRRDFSINAVAVALTPGEWGRVTDPTGGIADMRAGVVRALHDCSFWDDATRIVRAIGFEQRLGFVIEPETERWITQAAAHGALKTVSTERLGEAVMPLLANTVGPAVLKRASALGVPAALGARGAFTRRTLTALDEIPAALEALGEAERPQSRAVACLAALLLSRGVRAETIITRLHLDRATARELRSAERYLRRWPRGFRPAKRRGDLWEQLREATFGAIIILWLATTDAEARAALTVYRRELEGAKADIAAAELVALGYRPGPAFGDALRAALRAKLSDNADRDGQLAAARAAIASAGKSQG